MSILPPKVKTQTVKCTHGLDRYIYSLYIIYIPIIYIIYIYKIYIHFRHLSNKESLSPKEIYSKNTEGMKSDKQIISHKVHYQWYSPIPLLVTTKWLQKLNILHNYLFNGKNWYLCSVEKYWRSFHHLRVYGLSSKWARVTAALGEVLEAPESHPQHMRAGQGPNLPADFHFIPKQIARNFTNW